MGKVYLVGAGPGHPQLLTIKARELIATADIIIYDRLIQAETLAPARADAEQIYVGKAPERHQSRQPEINEILLDAARRAKVVVRLKGGDPVLFGRGGEEAEQLAANGIPFEVVPGVTAGLSVPMAAGIPVTHRDYGSAVALVTGHRRDDKEMKEIDWQALAKIDTLVFFMGVAKLPQIAARLMESGLSPDTPAAVVQMAYWPGEQAVIGSLEDLPRLAQETEIRPPATIVVGKVVRLRDKLTTLHRDLRRDQEEPVPMGISEEKLLRRIGSGLLAGKDVLAAMELDLFEDLEQTTSPAELARKHRLSEEALGELLARLAGIGVLLHTGDGTYRNSEAASCYLRCTEGSPCTQSIKEMVARALQYDPLAALRQE